MPDNCHTRRCYEIILCNNLIRHTRRHFRARFLSPAWGKLRLCSANHSPGYCSNLPCDWPSTAWAYSEQETENDPRWRLCPRQTDARHSVGWSYYPDSKVPGANVGPIWSWQDPNGPHIGPMNFAIWVLLRGMGLLFKCYIFRTAPLQGVIYFQHFTPEMHIYVRIYW